MCPAGELCSRRFQLWKASSLEYFLPTTRSAHKPPDNARKKGSARFFPPAWPCCVPLLSTDFAWLPVWPPGIWYFAEFTVHPNPVAGTCRASGSDFRIVVPHHPWKAVTSFMHAQKWVIFCVCTYCLWLPLRLHELRFCLAIEWDWPFFFFFLLLPA
ncbi:hypothetical protein BX600DRAFT_450600 [Xylariales sp. PMI_506]|nr:hypothetical protein BX600DRAFT_450600 [Xylariales sp. PMI_506]